VKKIIIFARINLKKIKNMKKIILSLLFASVLISCQTTNKAVQSVPFNIGTTIDPIAADYTVDINSKLKGSSESVWILGFKISGDPTYADGVNYTTNFGEGQEGFMRLFGKFAARKTTQVKAAAAYKAVTGTDADFIANPMYNVVQQKSFFGLVKTYKAEVTGYKGKYTKIYQNTNYNWNAPKN
jgi:hypothetical protein